MADSSVSSPSPQTFWDLHAYSVSQRAAFWGRLFDLAAFIHEGRCERVVDEALPIDAVPVWFRGVRLNFAENLLYSRERSDAPDHRSTRWKEDGKVAITEVREGGVDVQDITWGELRRRAGALAAAMKARGVVQGDRVVVVGANSIETALVWLATCWLGAIFSSSSTDMGVRGILQRTVQVDPKLLFFDDAAVYNGATLDLRDKMADVARGLRADCPRFQGLVVVPRFRDAPRDVSRVPHAETWASFLGSGTAAGEGEEDELAAPEFTRIDFAAPFLLCYSSGTTGTPKAIVHSVGGCMLNYWKEARLHEGLGPDSVTLQYTTVGWIMYVANVGTLLFGARSIMYDGSPFAPDALTLVRLLATHGVTKLGTSPRWLLELHQRGLRPRDVADLSALRVVTSTGMVLSDRLQHWFYDAAFPPAVHLGNISGGTDIAGCFGCLNPLIPVHAGGAQGPSLGVDVRVFDAALGGPDADDDAALAPGTEVPHGTPGELVAAQAFPNVPCAFWGDAAPPGRPGSRYHAAYFARFRGVWAHGDFVCVHPATRNLHFLGRADGVLNPSGVRFGSSDIYGVLERRFADRVADALCVGQRRPADADESVMLFLLMRPGAVFDAALVRDVRDAIAADLSKRHVPRWVFETWEIPVGFCLPSLKTPYYLQLPTSTPTPPRRGELRRRTDAGPVRIYRPPST